MITLYHNPRCRKSREGLALVEDSNQVFEVIHYLKEPLNKAQLSTLLDQLDIPPIELVRQGETIWKEHYKGKTMTDHEVIEAMAKHPKLIERPVVVKGDRAVIGRPLENIRLLLS